jgi:small subunit ribosomal protein YMR-31
VSRLLNSLGGHTSRRVRIVVWQTWVQRSRSHPERGDLTSATHALSTGKSSCRLRPCSVNRCSLVHRGEPLLTCFAENIDHTPKPHPSAPNGLMPSGGNSKSTYFNDSSIEPEEGVFFSRSQLSPRFRYTLARSNENDQVNSGGAEIVF